MFESIFFRFFSEFLIFKQFYLINHSFLDCIRIQFVPDKHNSNFLIYHDLNSDYKNILQQRFVNQIRTIFNNHRALGRCRRNHIPGNNHSRFCLSYVRLVCFLRNYADFHVMRTECQRVLIHLLLLISRQFLAMAR